MKRLADGLGERRDRDVAIAALSGFNEQLHVPDRKGVASLINRLRDEQVQANTDLAPLVEEARLAELNRNLNDLVASVRGREGAGEEDEDEPENELDGEEAE